MAFSDTVASTMTRCKSAFFTAAIASAVSIVVFKRKRFYAGFTHSNPDQTPRQHHQQAVQSRGAFEPDKQDLRFNRIWMVANNESNASSLGQTSARLVGIGSFNHRAFHF